MTEPDEERLSAPTSNLDAEQALLGAMMFDNAVVGTLDPALTAEHFHEPFHQRLFSAITKRIADGGLADPTLLHNELAADPAYVGLGGVRYLADLVDRAPPFANAASYAAPILETANRRWIATFAKELALEATDPARDPVSLTAEAMRALTDAAGAAGGDDKTLVDARTSMRATVAALLEEHDHGRARGAMTGIRCFDHRLGGLQAGKLIVLAGRPSMGKSGLARAGAFGAARRNPASTVAFFAIEMGREELDHRTLAQLSYERGQGVAYERLTSHNRPKRDVLERLVDLAEDVPENLLLDESGSLSVEQVRRRVLGLKRKRPVAAVFIDYLQIMRKPDARGRNEASVIGEMTAGLKQLARESGACIVVLSQLSRQCEMRENKRPMLSDLRDSGSIEQDADAVLFCYREHYYLAREGPKKGQSTAEHQLAIEECASLMEVICAKRRGGPIGTDRQRYLAQYDVVENEGEWS